jgi:DNA-binding NtrC family response regulator
MLAQRFLSRYCAANGLPGDGKTFSREALDTLTTYSWPGNIRELESTVARAALSAPGRAIRATDIEFLNAVAGPGATGPERLPSLRDAERAHILRILEAVSWNKKQASDVLEISRGTLYRKIAEYNLEPAAAARASRNGTEPDVH